MVRRIGLPGPATDAGRVLLMVGALRLTCNVAEAPVAAGPVSVAVTGLLVLTGLPISWALTVTTAVQEPLPASVVPECWITPGVDIKPPMAPDTVVVPLHVPPGAGDVWGIILD